MKRTISYIITVIIMFASVCSAVVNASPPSNASFSLKAFKYINDTYTEVDGAKALDTVVLQVSVNGKLDNVAGISLTLFYDSDKAVMRKQSDKCYIIDDKAGFNSRNIGASSAKKAHINAVWDTPSKNTSLSGLLFSFTFDILGAADTQSAVFGLKINDLFKSDKNQTVIPVDDVSDKIITVDNFDYSAFKKLKDGISYNEETLNNIIAAETVFRSFNSAQAETFVKNHRDLYDCLANARTTYNRLAQQAKQEEILTESKRFVTDFENLWNLSETDPSVLGFEKEILLAQTTYESLSDAAKTRISSVYPEKLVNLIDAIDVFKEDIEVAKEFREGEYSLLWNIDENTLKDVYSELFTLVDNAKIMYGGMSDFAKSMVEDLGVKLSSIENLINKYLESDEKAAALREKTNAFMKKWNRVFTLNNANVKAEDKSAIEMAIDDYDTLDDDVKEALASRINNIKKLLAVIASFDSAEDGTPIGNDVSGGKTETVIKTNTVTKTVKVPIKSDSDGNKAGSVKTAVKTIYSSLNKTTLFLSIIILFGLLLSVVPILLLRTLNKKIKLIEAENGEGNN